MSNLSFRTNAPQVTSAGEILTYVGKCARCRARVYRVDGGDPDPRGPCGTHNSANTAMAIEYDMAGPDVIFCYGCLSNDGELYSSSLNIAKQQWGKG